MRGALLLLLLAASYCLRLPRPLICARGRGRGHRRAASGRRAAAHRQKERAERARARAARACEWGEKRGRAENIMSAAARWRP